MDFTKQGGIRAYLHDGKMADQILIHDSRHLLVPQPATLVSVVCQLYSGVISQLYNSFVSQPGLSGNLLSSGAVPVSPVLTPSQYIYTRIVHLDSAAVESQSRGLLSLMRCPSSTHNNATLCLVISSNRVYMRISRTSIPQAYRLEIPIATTGDNILCPSLGRSLFYKWRHLYHGLAD
ncbi:hypothetical protein BJX70DRAFT_352898 [Aspergillus crustosus]